MKLNISKEWILRAAELEDGCCVTAISPELMAAFNIEAETPITAGSLEGWRDGPNASDVIWQVMTKDEDGITGPFAEFEIENAAKNAAWEFAKNWHWVGVRVRSK